MMAKGTGQRPGLASLSAVLIVTLLLAPLPMASAASVAAQGGTTGEERPAGIPEKATPAEVAGHIDGRTIAVVLAGEDVEVALIGIDVPRRGDGGSPGECYGEETFARLQDLLPEGTRVYLERDKAQRDDDDRLLRYVWLPGEGESKAALLNTKLVREGYAAFDPDDDNSRYDDRMEEQAVNARDQDRGLWGACGGVHEEIQPTPTPEPTVDEIKAQYVPLADVRELAIRPGGMMGQQIFFYGTIRTIDVARPDKVFVLGDDEPGGYSVAMQVDVVAPDGSSEYVFIGYNGDTAGMFEGSYVLVYATVVDTQTFQNALGGSVTQPLVSARFVELQ